MKTACFTGHRPSSFRFGYNEESKGFIRIDEQLRCAISDLWMDGYRRFYTGMAEGVDIWAAEDVLRATKCYEDIELYAVVPYPDQRNTMNEDFQKRYDHVLDCCIDVIYTSKIYAPDCFKKRNYYMVEHSDAVVAVYNPDKWRSGTGQTVRYAEKLGKRIIHINPNAR